MLRSDANPAFLPDAIGALIVQPVIEAAVATQVAMVTPTNNTTFRIPIVTEDPSAAWTAEGASITPSGATLAEAVITPAKLAGLVVISNELADDSSPASATVVGQGLARDLARRLDEAFFGNTIANGPSGLESLATTNPVDAGAAWTDCDPFNAAIFAAEAVGARVTAFVANPTDALALAQLKESATSNRDLLQPDATLATRRLIAGVPLYVSPAVTEGTIWGIPRDLIHVVMRKDTTLVVDRSAYFGTDSLGVRAVMRVGFGFPHPAAIQAITLGAAVS